MCGHCRLLKGKDHTKTVDALLLSLFFSCSDRSVSFLLHSFEMPQLNNSMDNWWQQQGRIKAGSPLPSSYWGKVNTESNQKGEHGVTPWMKGGICSYYWCCHTVFALTTCGMTARERVNPETHCNMKEQYINVSFSNFFLGAWTQAKFFEKLQVCVLYLQMSTESTVTAVLRQTLRVFPVMEGNV